MSIEAIGHAVAYEVNEGRSKKTGNEYRIANLTLMVDGDLVRCTLTDDAEAQMNGEGEKIGSGTFPEVAATLKLRAKGFDYSPVITELEFTG